MSEERTIFGFLLTVIGLAWVVVLATEFYGSWWKGSLAYIAIISMIDFGRWIRKPAEPVSDTTTVR